MRIWAGLGCLLLLITAGFHGSGIGSLSADLAEVDLKAPLPAVIKAIWLFVTVQWVALAVIAGRVALRVGENSRWILCAIAVLLLIDTAMIYGAVGFFIGEVMLASSALFFLIAAAHSNARFQAHSD